MNTDITYEHTDIICEHTDITCEHTDIICEHTDIICEHRYNIWTHKYNMWTHRYNIWTHRYNMWTHRYNMWTHMYNMWTHIYKRHKLWSASSAGCLTAVLIASQAKLSMEVSMWRQEGKNRGLAVDSTCLFIDQIIILLIFESGCSLAHLATQRRLLRVTPALFRAQVRSTQTLTFAPVTYSSELSFESPVLVQ